jgi:hypothetical protein
MKRTVLNSGKLSLKRSKCSALLNMHMSYFGEAVNSNVPNYLKNKRKNTT